MNTKQLASLSLVAIALGVFLLACSTDNENNASLPTAHDAVSSLIESDRIVLDDFEGTQPSAFVGMTNPEVAGAMSWLQSQSYSY